MKMYIVLYKVLNVELTIKKLHCVNLNFQDLFATHYLSTRCQSSVKLFSPSTVCSAIW